MISISQNSPATKRIKDLLDEMTVIRKSLPDTQNQIKRVARLPRNEGKLATLRNYLEWARSRYTAIQNEIEAIERSKGKANVYNAK